MFRGELVEEHNQIDVHCNMRLCRDPTTLMFTQGEDVAPLNFEEFLLVQGVDSITDRLIIFKNNGIDLGMSLVQGSKVYVAVFGPGHVKRKYVRAIVQFKGSVQGLTGTIFGVETMVSGKRSTNFLMLCLGCNQYFLSMETKLTDICSSQHVTVL